MTTPLSAPWEVPDDNVLAAREKRLAYEISDNNHPLSGIPVKAVASRKDNDDVLFSLKDGSNRVAVVHLTWAEKPEVSDSYPRTRFYDSFDQWLTQAYRQDVANF